METILYTANALMFWWLFVIWNKSDTVNLAAKMVFLAGAIANTIAALSTFGFIVLV